MRSTCTSPRITRLSFAAALVASVVVGPPAWSPVVHAAPCQVLAWSVSSGAELDEAIDCFNVAVASVEIDIDGDIDLGASLLPTIDNTEAGVVLTIDGGSRTITAGHTSRTLHVAPDTTATIRHLAFGHDSRGFHNQGTTTLDDVTISNLVTNGHGAAIFNNTTGDLTIVDSMLSGNTADTTPGDGAPDRNGGAIYNLGTLTITGTTITDNAAVHGGGIYSDGTLVIDEGTSITSNAATDARGGGIHNSGSMTITAATIDDNTVGGGIFNEGSTSITGTSVSDNSSVAGAGGISNTGSLEIFDSTIAENVARFGNGGGISSNGTLTIEDTTITGNTAGDEFHGGGIANSGTATMVDGRVSNNVASGDGGGISNRGTVTIDGTSIDGNDAINGAGIRNTHVLTATDVNISSNSATGHGGGIWNGVDALTTIVGNGIVINEAQRGGGIYNIGGGIESTGTQIGANIARVSGGGIHTESGSVNIIGRTIDFNRVLRQFGDEGAGGALYANESTVDLTDVTIAGNTSRVRGGALFVDGSTVSIERSTISGNEALDGLNGAPTGRGGGLFSTGASAIGIVNSTIDGNEARAAAGIQTVGGSLNMTFTTVTRNTGTFDGGLSALDPATAVRITASIIADNAGDDVAIEAELAGKATSGGYNVLGSIRGPLTTEPTDLTDITDLALGELEAIGEGLTAIRIPATDSPAVDLVPPGSGLPDEDQVGTNRPAGPGSDAGAVERAPDTDGDGLPDNVDNCPGDPNADQSDVDGDGVGDVCDPADDRSVIGSLTPARFADSRDEPTFDGKFRDTGIRRAGTTWEIEIAGRGDVSDNATAAVLNITTVGGAAPGFATVHPCGTLPNASSVNYLAGGVDPNEVIAKLSSTGTVCIYVLTDVHVLVDVVGEIVNSPYEALTPTRFADSRDEPTFDNQHGNTGIRRARTTWEIPIAGRGDVPADADAVAMNLTVTGGVAPGFATVHPCGTLPNASSLNYGPGDTRPNELVAKLSPTGTVCIYVLTDVHVIVDVVGAISADAIGYTALTPTRYADSRAEPTFDDQYRNTGIRGANTTWEIQIAGRGDVPTDTASAVINLTVTGGTAPGFATVHPCGELPTASSINYSPGTTRPNELVAKLSPTGTICVYTLAPTHVIVDIVGHT